MRYKQSLAIAAMVLGLLQAPSLSWAQSHDPFLGQLMMGAWNFCPTGWAKADGQLLPILPNQALFSLVGTMYGGDGQTTFALPDLRGRVPLHWGSGPGGLATQGHGEKGGEARHALTVNEMPMHQHPLHASMEKRPESTAKGNLLNGFEEQGFVRPGPQSIVPLHGMSVGPTGAGVPHNVMPPYLTVTMCIATQGVYPSRP